MNFGVVFPQTEYGNDPGAIRDYAQTAEALGYSHIVAYDHVLGANPDRPGGWSGVYTFKDAFHEPFALFSFMAGVTHKIQFVPGIIILPQRQTALVAKQAATLDVLSGGRLRLGIGAGWNPVEFTALNENFHNRGARMEEQVEVMRQLWAQPLVNFSGRWHTIPDAGIKPLPVQQPIPVWFGGHSEPALRRAARLGDGWLTNYRQPAEARQALEILADELQANGRSRAVFGVEARLQTTGASPESWRQLIQDWQSASATHFSLNTMSAGLDTPQKHLAMLRKFAETILQG